MNGVHCVFFRWPPSNHAHPGGQSRSFRRGRVADLRLRGEALPRNRLLQLQVRHNHSQPQNRSREVHLLGKETHRSRVHSRHDLAGPWWRYPHSILHTRNLVYKGFFQNIQYSEPLIISGKSSTRNPWRTLAHLTIVYPVRKKLYSGACKEKLGYRKCTINIEHWSLLFLSL